MGKKKFDLLKISKVSSFELSKTFKKNVFILK